MTLGKAEAHISVNAAMSVEGLAQLVTTRGRWPPLFRVHGILGIQSLLADRAKIGIAGKTMEITVLWALLMISIS